MQINKCETPKGLVISDKPCGTDATQIDIKKPTSSGIGMTAEGDWSKVTASNKRRELQRKISGREEAIARLERQRERELRILRSKRRRAANNLAGATWEQSIATEMNAVIEKYNALIEGERAEIAYLRERLRDLDV
ncbi:hypothetical protein FHR99_003139 [Litorivivens lipolytica]|uniref:Uncharacterized protein n=1 Tax=Litorivivens lipolytica TaxID=1524264 RepID=A0A7W4W7L1_9GAMM|nr:hypothetical protein [Litorivivens lipolytica]MBB3048865.1 hypothetical protein [Litorivivens lipolytica]